MTRIASFPHWYEGNPYYAALYAELARHGVDHVPGVAPESLARGAGQAPADVLHLHWAYALWRHARPWRRRRAMHRSVAMVERIRATGIPVVWTVHNLEPHDGYARGERDAYASLRSSVDVCLYHTHCARAEARRRFGPTTALELVTPHGVLRGSEPDATPAETRARFGIGPDGRLLLCFGQLRSNKGFDVALAAMDVLGEDHHLVVAGRPVDRGGHRLVRAARRHRRASAVAGFVEDRALASLLVAADAVLLPYRSVTGSGAFLHAVGCGWGVVATRLPFFAEVTEPVPAAVTLVDEPSAAALAAGVRSHLAEDAERRRALLDQLAAEYAWERCVGPLVDWIRDGARHSPSRNPDHARGSG